MSEGFANALSTATEGLGTGFSAFGWSDAIMARLPKPSVEKVYDLLSAHRAAWGVLKLATNDADIARQDLERIEIDANRRLETLRPRRYQDDVDLILAPIAPAKRRLERANAVRDRRVSDWQQHSYLGDVADWLRSNSGRLEHEPLPLPLLRKGEDPQAAVARIRSEIEAVDDEWSSVEAAVMPASVLREEIAKTVDEIATEGSLKIDPRLRTDPARLLKVGKITNAQRSLTGSTGFETIVWLLRDELVARLNQEIERLSLGGALGDDERAAAFSRLSAKRLDLERMEEATIVAAAGSGLVIHRRRDADPRAVLEIREV